MAELDYQRLLTRAIGQLSPQCRMVYTLSREKGLSHDQIARQLNLSRNTVKNYMVGSLKSIRSFLKNQHIPLFTLFL